MSASSTEVQMSLTQKSRRHPPSPLGGSNIATVAVRCISVACRYVLAGVSLLVPASVVTATSCADLNCGSTCDNRGGAIICGWNSASECSAYSFCAVLTSCFCSGTSSAVPEPQGCNAAACHVATNPTECVRTTGCEWGDNCREATDCHAMDLDETACRKNPRCSYRKDCG